MLAILKTFPSLSCNTSFIDYDHKQFSCMHHRIYYFGIGTPACIWSWQNKMDLLESSVPLQLHLHIALWKTNLRCTLYIMLMNHFVTFNFSLQRRASPFPSNSYQLYFKFIYPKDFLDLLSIFTLLAFCLKIAF